MTAARIGNLVFTSGISGIDLKTGKLAEGPERQFAQAFENLVALLQHGGRWSGCCRTADRLDSRPHESRLYQQGLAALYPAAIRPARKTNQAPLPDGVEVQLMAACVLGEKRAPLEIPGLSHKDPLPMGARWDILCSLP